jgi:hypothetical protein
MTTQLSDRAADDLIAESVDDAALAALLRTKPDDEVIPAAVWWLIAESLRTSVTIRRTLAADISPDREDLPILVAEARLLTEAALVELAESTGARPVPISIASPSTATNRPAGTRPSFGLQLSVLFLARMLVTQRATTPERLANTLAAHLRALAAVDVDA